MDAETDGVDPCGVPRPAVMPYSSVIAGITFRMHWNCPDNEILVWEGGQFYNLREAYDNGRLTRENLKEISDLHELVFYPDDPFENYTD